MTVKCQHQAQKKPQPVAETQEVPRKERFLHEAACFGMILTAADLAASKASHGKSSKS